MSYGGTYLKSLTQNIISDITGGMAVWAALVTPIFIGGAVLSVDAVHIYSLDQELQSAADALARAGSLELDQAPDSIERATRAINTLINNKQRFGLQSGTVIKAKNIRFLQDLPDKDYNPVTSNLLTDLPEEAEYVEVTVIPESVNFIFPKVVGSTLTKVTLDASSVAKSEQTVCGVAPIFVCNPWEDSHINLQTALQSKSFQRRLVRIKAPGSQAGPGNFGFIDPGAGVSMSEALGHISPPVCVSEAIGVTTQTGNISSLRFAMNTRFDIYEGSFKKHKSNPNYAPAQNVTKGYSGKGCNSSTDSNALALPRDTCFLDDSCPYLNGAQGDGNWDFAEYIRVNHNAAASLTIEDITYTFDHDNGTVFPNDIPTRYQVYRWEIDTDSIPGDVSYGTSSTPEEGTPQCHTYGPAPDEIDRRILVAAVLNCGELSANGELNGKSTDLPIEAFAKVFVTEPMGKGQDNIIWGEMAGPVISGRDKVSRERVSVVR